MSRMSDLFLKWDYKSMAVGFRMVGLLTFRSKIISYGWPWLKVPSDTVMSEFCLTSVQCADQPIYVGTLLRVKNFKTKVFTYVWLVLVCLSTSANFHSFLVCFYYSLRAAFIIQRARKEFNKHICAIHTKFTEIVDGWLKQHFPILLAMHLHLSI